MGKVRGVPDNQTGIINKPLHLLGNFTDHPLSRDHRELAHYHGPQDRCRQNHRHGNTKYCFIGFLLFFHRLSLQLIADFYDGLIHQQNTLSFLPAS
jgi:hypothetical protein